MAIPKLTKLELQIMETLSSTKPEARQRCLSPSN